MTLRDRYDLLLEWWKHRPPYEKVSIGIQTVIAGATIIYVVVASFQWCAMREANDISKSNAVAANRPWVGPVDVSIDGLTVGQSPKVNLLFTNFGHSPALHVTSRLNGIVVPVQAITGESVVNFIKRLTPAELSTHFPNQNVNATVPSVVITDDSLKQIKDRTAYFLVLGLVTYWDTRLETEHHTWIYATYAPDMNKLAIQKDPKLHLPPDD